MQQKIYGDIYKKVLIKNRVKLESTGIDCNSKWSFKWRRWDLISFPSMNWFYFSNLISWVYICSEDQELKHFLVVPRYMKQFLKQFLKVFRDLYFVDMQQNVSMSILDRYLKTYWTEDRRRDCVKWNLEWSLRLEQRRWGQVKSRLVILMNLDFSLQIKPDSEEQAWNVFFRYRIFYLGMDLQTSWDLRITRWSNALGGRR